MATVILSKELHFLLQDGPGFALIDVRERAEYNRGQILWATNVPRRELEFRMPQLIPLGTTRTVLYDDDGIRADLAANTLEKNGYTRVEVLKGGLTQWKESGYPLVEGVNVPGKAFGEILVSHGKVKEIKPIELKACLERGEEPIIVEVRPPEEVEHSGSIPGAINIQGVELPMVINDLSRRGKKIVVTCAGRTRGVIATLTLQMMGIDVYDLTNGTQGWVLAGFELKKEIPLGPKPSPESKARAEQFAKRLQETNHLSLVSAEKLEVLKQEKRCYAFDVRTTEEYASGHIPGSISLSGGQAIQRADDFIALRNSAIIFICDDMIRSIITAYWYKQMGYHQVYVLNGGIPAWLRNNPKLDMGKENVTPMNFRETWNKVEKTDALTLHQRLCSNPKMKLLYVGDSVHFRKGHIPGSMWLLRSFLEQRIGSLVPEKYMPIVVSCSDGINSVFAASSLMDLGYEAIHVLDGGTEAWQTAGLTLESGLTEGIGDPDDILPKSHERTREQMLRYLSWEEKLCDDPIYIKMLGHSI